jgi:hypothetical protein
MTTGQELIKSKMGCYIWPLICITYQKPAG